MSREHNRRVHQWPCDGVKRFKVGFAPDLTYAEAYQEIVETSGSTEDPKTKARTFTHEGFKRIAHLNETYLKIARNFVLAALEKKQRIEREAAAAKLEQQQTDERLALTATIDASHENPSNTAASETVDAPTS